MTDEKVQDVMKTIKNLDERLQNEKKSLDERVLEINRNSDQ